MVHVHNGPGEHYAKWNMAVKKLSCSKIMMKLLPIQVIESSLYFEQKNKGKSVLSSRL